MRSSRFLTFAGLVIIFCAVAGGFWGRSALVAQDQIPDQYKVFTSALGAIEDNYVGEYESDRLVYSAISGLLQTLDPHSSFMDPRSFAQMRERQEGRYYGLGISIQVIEGEITVFSLFEGSPAYQKGVRRGDVIARDGWCDGSRSRRLGCSHIGRFGHGVREGNALLPFRLERWGERFRVARDRLGSERGRLTPVTENAQWQWSQHERRTRIGNMS